MKIIGLLGNISHARRHLFSRELTRHIVEVCLHYFAPGRFFLSAEENRVMELTGVVLVSNHSRMHNEAWKLKIDVFCTAVKSCLLYSSNAPGQLWHHLRSPERHCGIQNRWASHVTHLHLVSGTTQELLLLCHRQKVELFVSAWW